MRISIEVGHPAHVHYWRNFIRRMNSRGHEVYVLARRKEITLHLLRAYGIPFRWVGLSRPGLVKKGLGMPIDDLRVLRAAREMHVEFMLSTGIPGSAHASRILGIPHVSLIDTEIATLGRLLTEPFSDLVCTPSCFTGRINPRKHVRFKGYLELMYLHPRYFRPDPSVLETVGVDRGTQFAVARFSSWDSSHDVGRTGAVLATNEDRIYMIEQLVRRFRIFVSSEIPLPTPIERYRLRLSPDRFHDLLAFASLYIGDGATAASEASVLGVPWLYVSRSPRSYLKDQATRYDLGRISTSIREAAGLVDEWPSEEERRRWPAKRARLLNETIDVTEFMAGLVDRWPESKEEALRIAD
jgi:predicted glycosyltransferase